MRKPPDPPQKRTDYRSRKWARTDRNMQWRFMERVAREGIVWTCPWDKYGRHQNGDGVYVYGLLGCNEFHHWLSTHKDWWKVGRWSKKRCARPIRITAAGLTALANRDQYDMEPICGGMVEPGFVVVPLPRKRLKSGVSQ